MGSAPPAGASARLPPDGVVALARGQKENAYNSAGRRPAAPMKRRRRCRAPATTTATAVAGRAGEMVASHVSSLGKGALLHMHDD